jgi:diaminohydroxyphosphoribosylaminopyrimidine deaminase/5-amino-6-(5-phosphoribosylamino)uracil reductase
VTADFTPIDECHLRLAISLAEKGLGHVSPNPPVGCVLAHGKNVVGEGWHQQHGAAHAEVNALAAAGENARGATAYVTLMPCAHHGKTPPCTDALIRAGVARVVVALDDPNPASLDGRAVLEEAGIAVSVGLLAEEAGYVMRGFLKNLATRLPFLTLKWAMTLDGKIATSSGNSKWISCEESRRYVQKMRSQHDAVMVGIGTALADDPRLNVREPGLPQPRRVIVDSSGRLDPKARLFRERGGEVIVLMTRKVDSAKVKSLETAGATVIRLGGGERVDLREGLEMLADLGVRMVLCEGGSKIAGSLLEYSLVDEVVAFVAPKLAGGKDAYSPIGGKGLQLMEDAIPVNNFVFEKTGYDFCLRGRVGQWSWLTPSLQ